jgi:hypothetical protein
MTIRFGASVGMALKDGYTLNGAIRIALSSLQNHHFSDLAVLRPLAEFPRRVVSNFASNRFFTDLLFFR